VASAGLSRRPSPGQGDRVAVHYGHSAALAEKVLAGLPGGGHCARAGRSGDPPAVREMVDQAAETWPLGGAGEQRGIFVACSAGHAAGCAQRGEQPKISRYMGWERRPSVDGDRELPVPLDPRVGGTSSPAISSSRSTGYTPGTGSRMRDSTWASSAESAGTPVALPPPRARAPSRPIARGRRQPPVRCCAPASARRSRHAAVHPARGQPAW
jgi:hypothetical protein